METKEPRKGAPRKNKEFLWKSKGSTLAPGHPLGCCLAHTHPGPRTTKTHQLNTNLWDVPAVEHSQEGAMQNT
jgi:hypothetical protein